MAYSDWPFECPNSWQETPARGVIRTTLDEGQAKVRRRYTKSWQMIQTSFRLPVRDYQRFWDFFNQDCGGGSVPFMLNHPILKTPLKVRFSKEPEATANVGVLPYFDVSANLEVMF